MGNFKKYKTAGVKMKIVYSIILILSIWFITSHAQTQQSSEEDILKSLNNNYSLQGNNPSGNENVAIITQSGSDNIGLINQFQNEYNVGNYANISQDGNYNSAVLYEYGYGISADITQTGNFNYANVVLDGNNIDGSIMQDGYGNYINQNLGGADFNYTVLQDGNNNLLIQDQGNIYSSSFEISQVGDGITTIIINP
jgi:hypothetical protein